MQTDSHLEKIQNNTEISPSRTHTSWTKIVWVNNIPEKTCMDDQNSWSNYQSMRSLFSSPSPLFFFEKQTHLLKTIYVTMIQMNQIPNKKHGQSSQIPNMLFMYLCIHVSVLFTCQHVFFAFLADVTGFEDEARGRLLHHWWRESCGASLEDTRSSSHVYIPLVWCIHTSARLSARTEVSNSRGNSGTFGVHSKITILRVPLILSSCVVPPGVTMQLLGR